MGQMTGSSLWHMADVLYQYAVPYDPLRPLLCCDARPCFLSGAGGSILPMSPGKAKRHHDAYDKNGACCVLLAFEPHPGFRDVDGRQQRTAVDYAPCMKNLLEQHSPPIAQIRLVQDNLHTHTPGAFYDVLPPAEAFAWSQQFVPHYPPKKGSWVNMAEIACAALSTQGLHRRIAEGDTLRQEVLAWATKRNHERTTVQWRFSQTDARTTLQRHYQNVQKFI